MYFLEPIICPVCGKEFIPVSQHVYKDQKGRLVCSWHCTNASYMERKRRKQEARERAKHNGAEVKRSPNHMKPVELYTKSGIFIARYSSVKEAANETGYSNTRISMVCNGKVVLKGDYTFKFAKSDTEGEKNDTKRKND